MNKLSIKAEKRKLSGRKVKKLRREGLLPANIYGKNTKSQQVQVNLSEFLKLYQQAGETSIVELLVNGDKKPVLIHNLQVDPVTDTPLHADFLQVNLKEKVTAQIPVELTGEAPSEKQGLGTVVQYINEIEVEALPTDLPDKFEIDLSKLEAVDDMVQIKDIKVEKGKVELKGEMESIIVKVEPPRKEEEVPAPTPEAEVAEGEPAVTEGEATPKPAEAVEKKDQVE